MQAKRILILVDTPRPSRGHADWLFFRDSLRQSIGPDVQVEMSALAQLTFLLHGEKAKVYDGAQNFSLQDFDLIIFRRISKRLDLAVAVAAFCRKKSIPYIDTYISKASSCKLGGAFLLWEHDLPTPATIYGPTINIIQSIKQGEMSLPLIAKDNEGKQGRNNFLVHNLKELAAVLQNDRIKFVVQPYIMNEGDYRILVLNGRARVAILRRAAPGSHLNNTSQNGMAQLIDLNDLRPDIIELAQEAALVSKVQVAGVDIIVDKNTKKASILEVNSAPQLVDGAFVGQKMVAYAKAVKELVGKAKWE